MKHTQIAFRILLSTALFAGLFITSCKDDDNTTEQENITTVVVHLIATDGSLNHEFEWNDLDGVGGNAPAIDSIALASGKTYSCHVHVYDRSKTPEQDVTEEIEAENTAHLFVYTPSNVNVTITPTDTDDDGKPFRLETTWAAGATSSGTVNIQLKHEPDKSAANPDVTGETDFDVTFPVKIQ